MQQPIPPSTAGRFASRPQSVPTMQLMAQVSKFHNKNTTNNNGSEEVKEQSSPSKTTNLNQYAKLVPENNYKNSDNKNPKPPLPPHMTSSVGKIFNKDNNDNDDELIATTGRKLLGPVGSNQNNSLIGGNYYFYYY